MSNPESSDSIADALSAMGGENQHDDGPEHRRSDEPLVSDEPVDVQEGQMAQGSDGSADEDADVAFTDAGEADDGFATLEAAEGDDNPAQMLSSPTPADAASQQPSQRVPATSGARIATATAPTRRKGGSKWAAPLLIGMGALMLLIALWATALLLGLSVPMHQREDAGQMAKLMLIAWPIALLLLVFAGLMVLDQRSRNRKSSTR